MTNEYTIYEKQGNVAYVTLNRPEVMNALHRPAHEELLEIFADFANDPDLVVAVITGAGDRAFSAGNDLKVTAAETDANVAPDPEIPFGAITSGFTCSKPLIAAVNGVAVGGGCEMVLACDIVVAAEHATFGLPEPRVGLVAGAGGVHRLVRQVPFKHAMGMLLTGRPIDAQEALRIGLANEVVPAGEVMAAARRWADAITACSPMAIQLTKESALDGLNLSVDEALARDRVSRLPRLFASADFVEGPKAFIEKRKPVWTAVE